ncbi:hypothetical protein ACI2OX_09040 [Bacillus sp. N9]
MLGEVCDICIQETGYVSDVLLQQKGLIGKKSRLSIHHILSFGENGIMIANQDVLLAYKEDHSEYTMHHAQPISKK